MSEKLVKVVLNLCFEPAGVGTHPEGTCWRCGGKGTVLVRDGTTTPCGACLGKTPPIPCPKCGANRAKMTTDSMVYVWWECRECGHRSEASQDDFQALDNWNNQPKFPLLAQPDKP